MAAIRIRTSHKPGLQLVRYLGIGPQLTNTGQKYTLIR